MKGACGGPLLSCECWLVAAFSRRLARGGPPSGPQACLCGVEVGWEAAEQAADKI